MARMISFYNSEVKRFAAAHLGKSKEVREAAVDRFINTDPRKISWDFAQKVGIERERLGTFQNTEIVRSIYRPFAKSWLYFDGFFNIRVYQMPSIFPAVDSKNRVICVTGIGETTGFSCLMSDVIPNLHFVAGSQCFPLYLYDEVEADAEPQSALFDNATQSGRRRREALTNEGRLADSVSSLFVYAVVGCAALTFAVWALFGPAPRLAYALLNAVAVLIIACPCALGLATPMSIMVGIGRGATAGLLIKNAEALEILSKVDTLVVDKTGTLTIGKPTVSAIIPLDAAADILQIAASLERSSEHPLAAAILTAAEEQKLALLDAADFRSFPGKGVIATIDGKSAALGNARLLEDLGIRAAGNDDAGKRAEELRKNGQTVVFVVVDARVAGIIGVSDPVKPDAEDSMRLLHANGLRIIMLTGDHQTAAQAVAQRLGIDDVRAGVLPEMKAQTIRELQDQGRIVAMAGDGTNDAPALAQAQVGIVQRIRGRRLFAGASVAGRSRHRQQLRLQPQRRCLGLQLAADAGPPVVHRLRQWRQSVAGHRPDRRRTHSADHAGTPAANGRLARQKWRGNLWQHRQPVLAAKI